MAARVLRTGLIGSNIRRTRLPAALQLMCQDAELKLEFSLIDTEGDKSFDLSACVEDCRKNGWAGVSVTHPFKPPASVLCDGPARRLGASNLLIFGTPCKALNTDYTGFLSVWKTLRNGQLPGCIAMAGAGGVARAIGTALAELGAVELVIWDKVAEKAETLANEIGKPARIVPLARSGEEIRAADGLVNATNLGMAGYGSSAIPSPLPGAAQWAFDVVYTPATTPFIAAAERSGTVAISGFELFKHMAVNQFTELTGLSPAQDTIERLHALMPPEAAA